MKKNPDSLREMGARAVGLVLEAAGADRVDSLYLGNMLSDELQGQKHTAALIADAAGLSDLEALDIRAATATGAAALRMAYLSVASGQAELSIAAGVEKMSDGDARQALARALDAETEIPAGETLLSMNARLMQLYLDAHKLEYESFAPFAVNAHANAVTNPLALFRREIDLETVKNSKLVAPPMRLYDCAPVCDGAAAVMLAPTAHARKYTETPVQLLASAASIDRFRIEDRADPLGLTASRLSAEKAFRQADIKPEDIDFFEVHDAFSIMSCLALEACGFAERGQGWRMARDGDIRPGGRLPIATMGGLKARGHPIGATALYQTCEIFQQLTGSAGPNQLKRANRGLLQSIGGAGTTILTHLFGT